MRHEQNRTWGYGLAAMVALLGWSEASDACGGLFCSLSNPVEQTAERIVFAQGEERITVIIEVQYQGPSEKFGWLIPMPGTPKIDVSTVEVLDALTQATAPNYRLNVEVEGNCAQQRWVDAGAVYEDSPGYADAGVDPPAEVITVLDEGNAGPYDYVTIGVNAADDDAAQAAIDWLVESGYDVGATAPDLLRPYLEAGLSLVAFRLTKGNETGAIRPVKITYDGNLPSIPLRPTAVAAQNDMQIQVFLLGDSRAVSDNFLGVELNEARINWFNSSSGYTQLVTEAVDEAGRYAFVTEFAGKSSSLKDQIWDDYLQQSWTALQNSGQTGVDLLMDARFPFARYSGFRRAVEASVMLSDGVSFDDFAAYPRGYQEQATVDQAKFLAQLENEVVEPLRSAQQLVDEHEYLTRMFTTLSPDEMTIDPTFVYNADLADVSNVHTATQTLHCSEEYYEWQVPWTITLADGGRLKGGPSSTPWAALNDAPAAARVLQYGSSGAAELVMDQTGEIMAAISELPEPVAGPVAGSWDAGSAPRDGTSIAGDAGAPSGSTSSGVTGGGNSSSSNGASSTDGVETEPRGSAVATDAGVEPLESAPAQADKITGTGVREGSGCSVAAVPNPARGVPGHQELAGFGLLGAALLLRRRA